jgi:hypothetical protein
MVSGSLLWIRGKRKYTVSVVLIVTNECYESRIDSWLWEDYSQVRFPPRVAHSNSNWTSSVITRHIESMPNAASVFLAYFFFDFKDEGKKDSRALLSSLLDQLLDQSDHFRDVLRKLFSKYRDGSKKPHDDALLRCLKDMLTMARSVPIYLVMDALDECPNDSGDLSSRSPRGKVLRVVEELVKLRLPNLRLCITSRPELDIRTIMKPLATHEMSLHEESGQNRDINAYITFVVQSVKSWRDDDKKMVIDKLTENADGM